MKRIPLVRPYLSPRGYAAVQKVLASGQWVQGPWVRRFEQRVERHFPGLHAVAVSSGTAALHVALLALGIGPGDEVIVPAFTFPSPAHCVERTGARCVFADVTWPEMNMDLDQVYERISKKTKAVIAVHQFGRPLDVSALHRFLRRQRIFLIEDAACALGSKIDGQRCGTMGDIATLSFHPRKIISTGEGGMVLTAHKKWAALIRSLRNHGREDRHQNFLFVHAGLNYRMTEMAAVMGLDQMKTLASALKARRVLATLYHKELMGLEEIDLPGEKKGMVSSYQSYVVLIRGPFGRASRLIQVLRSQGVESGIGTFSVPHQPYFRKKYALSPRNFPNSYRAMHTSVSLPLYPGLKKTQVKTVCRIIRKHIQKGFRS